MAYVAKKITTPDLSTIKIALRRAFVSVFGVPPNPNQLALMLAQTNFETNYFKKCYNYNVGNVRPGASWTGDKTSFAASEVIDGVNKVLKENDPGNQFRAYSSFDAGALDYVRQLGGNEDWKVGLMSGRPDMFVQRLVANPDRKYFTASPEQYLGNIRPMFLKYGGSETMVGPIASPSAIAPSKVPNAADRSVVTMPVLKHGDTGPAVRSLQHLINQRTVWARLSVDGLFGDETLSAVKRVQGDALIAIDGATSTALWEVLTS